MLTYTTKIFLKNWFNQDTSDTVFRKKQESEGTNKQTKYLEFLNFF